MRYVHNFKALILIVLGSLLWSLTMVKSGLLYPFGMGFWGPNGHDGVWHIALIASMSKDSFDMPVFAGQALQNYHIGFDLLMASIHRLTNIPAHTLYFQIIPPILALLIGFLTYKLVFLWRNSYTQAFWATFFVYFGGSLGWVVTLLRGEGLGGESMFWSQQAISTLVNPPFALSLVVLLVGLILLLKLQEKFAISHLAFSILLFGVLVQIKAYAALLAFAGLFVAGLWQFFYKKQKHSLLILILALPIAVLLLLPLNKASASLAVFQPFWFLETMMSYTDRVGWTKFYEAMTTYRFGGIFLKAIPAYILAFAIFWFGNLGTRALKEILVFKWIKKPGTIDFFGVFMGTVIFAGVVLPMLFVQAGTPWNTIQFIYYSLFFSGILAGITVGEWMEKNQYKLVLGFAVVILTIPTIFATLTTVYLPGRPPAKISHEELAALSFLKDQPDGIVLTYPFDRGAADMAITNPPRPLYLYESTAYVSAFSGKAVFLEDEVNLDITGFEWRERRDESKIPFESLNESEVVNFLERNKIRYLYLVLSQTPVFGQRFRLGESQLGLTNIFENQEVVIYAVAGKIEL